MIPRRSISRTLGFVIAAVLVVTALVPAASRARAESATLVVSVPSLWEDTLTDDVLSSFETQYGVDVVLEYTDTAFFGGGPGGGGSAIDDTLDSTAETVMAADVLYVSSSDLTPFTTAAGYYLDLSPLVSADPSMDSSDFVPAAWQSFQWDNGMWAIPLSVDVILLTYDTAAFDAAGLAYPTTNWTIDDFANAARQLTLYDADGAVDTVGLSTFSGGNNLSVLLRALLGTGVYDASVIPASPSFSANSSLQYILDVWNQMVQDGVVQGGFGGGGGGLSGSTVAMTVSGINGYTERGFNPNQETEDSTTAAVLLPGGVAGLTVQGFAVSAGTQNPEIAYALAAYLSTQSALASNQFSASPARYSLMSTDTTAQQQMNGGDQGGPGGQGGGPGGGGFLGSQTIPDAIQPVVDQGLTSAIPASDMRYMDYVTSAVDQMSSSGLDAASALQTTEAQAVSDLQTAVARYGTESLYVIAPTPEPTLAPGKIALNCAVNTGFGGGGPGGQGDLANQDQWDQLVANFTASDPDIGQVNLTSVNTTNLTELASTYDCFILSSNAVTGSDVSMLLNLDPLMDNDPSFDRNDVIGNTLAQVQQDNKTYALPLAISPQLLQYDTQQFALAGVPEPTNGWTIDVFVDALRTLKQYDNALTPFQPNDPSGSYLLMLIAAYGGLPVDYRTDPATLNFTDQTTIDAIQQVLDLVNQGYLGYSSLSQTVATLSFDMSENPAISTTTLNRFNFGGGRGPGGPEQETTESYTTYPQGTQYTTLSYEITTGYISATAQNPDATYRFLSAVSGASDLFSGIPARQSLLSSYTGEMDAATLTALYQQVNTLLNNANTIVFPTFTQGGGSVTSMFQSYWLFQAFDNYLAGSDLQSELENAQMITQTYLDCVASYTPDTTTTEQPGGQMFEQIMTCASSADPSFTMGGN
ncbi:ABC transporter substrate-binding protein [Aggregatilinea lenta]|uniref:ABC transporter substrate-binding protein n=1 Tax=Aggregatilinea lenta TaxID=913108 RepID=UPI000E5B6AF8|nr:extracellular solute-binding protein [Aggregatilinea lenta]